jgi:hypothetical protein
MIGYGFDPSYRGPMEMLDGRLHMRPCCYDEQCREIAADIIVCRHVIEHISQPLLFFVTLRQALARSPHARMFFETPTIEWILQNQMIWDIYYEHCSYFAPTTITFALEMAGFQVERIEHTFGNQYLWIEATLSQKQQRSSAGRQPGSLPRLGAAGKGVTLANLIDPMRN